MHRGPFQPGDRCNQYKIVRSLGEGGFGHVYEAVKEFPMLAGKVDQPFGLEVALKCLVVDQAADPASVERLNLEALLLLKLQHRNIVGFHDFGTTADGTMYFAMDLLRGSTLRDFTKMHPFSVARALYVAAEIAEGVAHAHCHGVTHRDLKPSNIFVTEEEEEIKVFDFGAAKYKHFWGQVTAVGQMAACTVTYAAPEQLRGLQTVDGRADVFSLGVITYKLITGTHPFCENVDATLEQMARQYAAETVPLAELGVHDYIANVIHGALAKNPDERPTMAEFRDQLREVFTRYADGGAFVDSGLRKIAERRSLHAHMREREDSDLLGHPPVSTHATTKIAPIVHSATEVLAAERKQRAVVPDETLFETRTRTYTIPEAAVLAHFAHVKPRIPRKVGLLALGILMLLLGFIALGWPSKGTAEMRAARAPFITPPLPEPIVAAPSAPSTEAIIEPPATPEPLPAPKPAKRKDPLQGIHKPTWETIPGTPPKSALK